MIRRHVQKSHGTARAICTTSLFLAASFAASAAHAGPGKEIVEDPFFRNAEPKSLDIMHRQETLSRAASVVRWEIERSKAAGYTSLRLEDDAVVLRWKGAVPTRIQKSINNAWKIAPVRVETAKYSQAELKAAARRLGSIVESNPGQPFHAVEIVNDESIRISTIPGTSQTLAKAALPLVDVPVDIVDSKPMDLASRLDDSAPWWGGARIAAWRGTQFRGYCTSGFGVTAGLYEYILTAAHCATYPDSIKDWAGEFIGSVANEDWPLDILLVRTDAGHRIFDGGVGSGEFSKAVSGWDWVYRQEWLCDSGSVSGVICGFQVSNDFAETVCGRDSDGDYTCMNDLVLAHRTDGGNAVLSGDSGGPVFSLDGSRVRAKGTITGGGGNRLLFQDFGTTWRRFGVVPLTGY